MTRDAGPLKSRLGSLRARARWMLIVAGVCVLVCASLAAVLSAGLLDYAIRLPSWFRIVMWVGGIASLVLGIRRWLLPALGFRPTLTEVALRIEQSEEGVRAGLRGVLTSGLELAEQRTDSEHTRAMATHVVDEALAKFGSFRGAAALSPVRVRHSLLTLSVCVLATAAIGLASGVRLFGVGAQRVLTPWADVQWPKRTGVSDVMAEGVHALGTPVLLRAAVTRTDQKEGQTRVAAKYRVISDAGATPVTRVLLNSQGRTIGLTDGVLGASSGELFERLIELGAVPRSERSSRPAELEYWFETDDDSTPARRMRLVESPTVTGATLKVRPPAYAESASKSAFVAGMMEMGSGNDQHAVVGPVLAGSDIELSLRVNKRIPMPASSAEGESEEVAARRVEWLGAVMPGGTWGPSTSATFDGISWVLRFRAEKSMRLAVRPVDEFGLKAADEAAYSLDVVEDRKPSAAVIEPREDESVLATAVVSLTAEGRDDVGVKSVDLTRQLAQSAKGSIGAAPEAGGESTLLASGKPEEVSTQATVSYELDLATIQPAIKAGQELWITAATVDSYELDGAKHEVIKSPPRKLRIIKEEELIEQVRTELGAVRKTAMRLDEEQAELKKAVDQGTPGGEERRRQAGLTQRISTQRETVDRLAKRAERNRLSDEPLTGLLKDLSDLLQGATKDSEQAAGQLDAAARQQGQQAESDQKTELTREQSQEIGKVQDSVRDQLGRVAQALDQGEDSWLAERSLQRVLQQQRDLKAQTDRLGEKTMGKRPEDLTPQERSELSQLADRQQRLSEQARQAIDQLAQRAQQMQKADAAQAAGMQKAADRGRQQQVPEKMQEAARDAEKNQTSEAAREQEEAIQSLEQMAQDMNQAQKNRDSALRRTLADILQSLDRLIADQTKELGVFAAAKPDQKFEGLDGAMISLNQNTLDVAEKARSDRAMAKIAETIDRAAGRQAEAVKALRSPKVDDAQVEQAETESLRLLKLAREEAKKIQDEAAKRDQTRQLAELRKVYREALEQQLALQADTAPFIGKPVERKDRARVRSLGDRQEQLRASLEDLRKKTTELEDAKVIGFAHDRIDGAAAIAAKNLRAAQPTATVGRNQETVVRVLKSLVEALSEKSMNEDEFKEEEGGEGGGGGGGGGGNQKKPLVPPLAELRVLRGMQQEAADLTRVLDDAKEASDEVAGLGELQRNLAERGKELVKQLEQQQQQSPKKPEKE